MSKPNTSNILKSIRKTITKHSPEILTGIGIAGMVTTVIFAVRATPKALVLLEEKQTSKTYENESDRFERLTPIEMIRAAWKCYLPTAILGSFSIICLLCANSESSKRNTTLATAYTLSESALREYQGKIVETIGEKKEISIRDAIAKDKIDKDPVKNQEVIITGKGNTLCYDVTSGRYFTSDIDKLKKIENELNRQMLDEMYISLNDFYYAIGLKGTSVGNDLGWKIDDGYIDLHFSSQLAEDGTPCLVIGYSIAPKYDYYK